MGDDYDGDDIEQCAIELGYISEGSGDGSGSCGGSGSGSGSGSDDDVPSCDYENDFDGCCYDNFSAEDCDAMKECMGS